MTTLLLSKYEIKDDSNLPLFDILTEEDYNWFREALKHLEEEE